VGANIQPTPVTNAATPGSARPSQAAAKLLEEITYKTLGLPDANALARAETQTLL
jgi:glutamate/tyrosine decarboxylase-like PLP-dependent enzyme